MSEVRDWALERFAVSLNKPWESLRAVEQKEISDAVALLTEAAEQQLGDPACHFLLGLAYVMV